MSAPAKDVLLSKLAFRNSIIGSGSRMTGLTDVRGELKAFLCLYQG